MMSINRQDRERVVLDLYYNRGKTIREIAKEARISFRDIGAIKKKAEGEKEAKQGQAQQTFASTQAYKEIISKEQAERMSHSTQA